MLIANIKLKITIINILKIFLFHILLKTLIIAKIDTNKGTVNIYQPNTSKIILKTLKTLFILFK